MATRGGARPGGGRPKGAKTRRTKELAAAAAAAGVSPLEYMLLVMRNPKERTERRDKMAIAAAPFIHPRLASTELKGDQDRPVVLEVLRDPKQEKK